MCVMCLFTCSLPLHAWGQMTVPVHDVPLPKRDDTHSSNTVTTQPANRITCTRRAPNFKSPSAVFLCAVVQRREVNLGHKVLLKRHSISKPLFHLRSTRLVAVPILQLAHEIVVALARLAVSVLVRLRAPPETACCVVVTFSVRCRVQGLLAPLRHKLDSPAKENLLAECVNLGRALCWFQPRPVPHAALFVDLPPRSTSGANTTSSLGCSAVSVHLAVLLDQLAREDDCRRCIKRRVLIVDSTRRSRNLDLSLRFVLVMWPCTRRATVLASTAWAQPLRSSVPRPPGFASRAQCSAKLSGPLPRPVFERA